ncbi:MULTISPECIES: ABC transporter substrate-binding protein [unclassified Crossiella]|uniref:ABC transporter substrate-binding protein n=1 Tax=unclassified Crossiella TaxID=2620835 RepID=UPI001FFED243|nr:MULTISPECIES: substrate-binding domain-containing protein [unclassified Crossiella]MCK2241664.1 substrate-binding domain-containing protein [Crossiella sp. S99.2]MCK2255464.1 substrate-binding domain-containing protein [Crossiella sp. S99.1]
MIEVSRRNFLLGMGALGGAAVLGGCATSASSGAVQQTAGAVSIQSNLSAPAAKAAIEALAKGFSDSGAAKAAVNTVASETFRTQLPSYLTSATPPDTYTWYPGSILAGYARKGLLLDVGDVWQGMGDYSQSFRTLSGDGAGKLVFVPTTYYWWGFFYRKSNFARWGVTPPNTWSEFLALCETLRGKGIEPIGLGAGGGTQWTSSAWFDYLNIRINGAPFHRDLLAGKGRFDDPKVAKVLETWKTVLPHFDPRGTAIPFQDATTSLLQGRTGMMLIGTFFADAAPKEALDDIDFFQFPILDPAVPVAEEAPTDGFFASSRTPHLAATKEFLKYAATAPAQELYIRNSSGTILPAHPSAKDSGTPLVLKGRKMLQEAKELTQFFNRDSSDALQPTADTALIRFIQRPNEISSILTEWQAAAQKVWNS